MTHVELTSTPIDFSVLANSGSPDYTVSMITATTLTAATAMKPQAAEPATDLTTGSVVFSGEGFHGIQVRPFGTDAANEAGSMQLVRWNKVVTGLGRGTAAMWFPEILYTVGFTLGALVGIDGELLENEYFFADTIATPTVEPTDFPIKTLSITDGVATAIMNCMQADLLELQIVRGTAASVNALIAPVRG